MFTEKHLKGSKSTYHKGLSLECALSLKARKDQKALLVSQKITQPRGLGRPDLVWWSPTGIAIIEAKHSLYHTSGQGSHGQRHRLIKLSVFLHSIFDQPVTLLFCSDKEGGLGNWFLS